MRRLTYSLIVAVLVAVTCVGSPAGARATNLDDRIHALGCDVGAAPGYGDRVVLLPNGDVQRWSFDKLVRETVADRFFWMVGNCPTSTRA